MVKDEVKPLLPENPTAKDLLNCSEIIDYLIPELRKRGREKEAEELELKSDLYTMVAHIMISKGRKTLNEGILIK